MAHQPLPTFKSSPALQAAMYYARKANRGSASVVDVSSLATGSILFPSNPLSNQTITIGGTVVTFGTNVTIGASLVATLNSLLVFLNASVDANLAKHTYVVSATALGIKAKSPGVLSTLVASNATVSASTLEQTHITQRKPL